MILKLGKVTINKSTEKFNFFTVVIFRENFSFKLSLILVIINYIYLGLQMTDVELDERVTALEENNGGGNTENGNKWCHSGLPFLTSKSNKSQSFFCIKNMSQPIQVIRLNSKIYLLKCLPHWNLSLSILETIAFTAALPSYSSISYESAVEFNVVLLNEGDGWVPLHA